MAQSGTERNKETLVCPLRRHTFFPQALNEGFEPLVAISGVQSCSWNGKEWPGNREKLSSVTFFEPLD